MSGGRPGRESPGRPPACEPPSVPGRRAGLYRPTRARAWRREFYAAAAASLGAELPFALAAFFPGGDTNGTFDVFVRDRQSGTTERVSANSLGVQANSQTERPSISADGRFVAFLSWATNLVPGDTNTRRDVFLRDLHPSGFASSCEPGTSAGVTSCPCLNPPAGSGRGCDNSAVT